MVFLVKNVNIELHHSILHNQINLTTKFQFKETILMFCIKFAIKGSIVGLKQKMITAIEFPRFQLEMVLNFSLN